VTGTSEQEATHVEVVDVVFMVVGVVYWLLAFVVKRFDVRSSTQQDLVIITALSPQGSGAGQQWRVPQRSGPDCAEQRGEGASIA